METPYGGLLYGGKKRRLTQRKPRKMKGGGDGVLEKIMEKLDVIEMMLRKNEPEVAEQELEFQPEPEPEPEPEPVQEELDNEMEGGKKHRKKRVIKKKVSKKPIKRTRKYRK